MMMKIIFIIFEEAVKASENQEGNSPYLNLDFLSDKTKEKIREENNRKFSVNSVDSDISANVLPIISQDEFEKIKDIIEQFNLGKKDNNEIEEEK